MNDTTKQETDDLRIAAMKQLVSPERLISDLPISADAAATVASTRKQLQDILHGRDDRAFVIVGPCSIHDTEAALDYARRIVKPLQALKDDLLVIMRVYFEKPRTTVGWKGLINDPNLDGSFLINEGLHKARKLLLELNEMGVPTATEYLDLISPQYIADLVSWGAIGARTTESQCHRELASGLSCPVGFKNGTSGNVQIAIDAVGSAIRPHHFLSVTKEGHSAIFETAGNPDCHIILRGGSKHTNYDPESIRSTVKLAKKAGINTALVVDCSHANSGKDPDRQIIVCKDVAGQIASGDKHITGLMLESHLVAGSQKVVDGQPLTYGQSITDACMGWEDTENLLNELTAAVRSRRNSKSA